jgi:pyruvate/2-oxoglutarate dehydrogenase complex dihydrolipoamide dehydrogenase (E3) component
MQHNLTSPSLKNGDKAEAEVLLVSETSIPDSYAIGDVTGKAMLAHVAFAQGKIMRARAMKLGATVSQVGDMIHAHTSVKG